MEPVNKAAVPSPQPETPTDLKKILALARWEAGRNHMMALNGRGGAFEPHTCQSFENCMAPDCVLVRTAVALPAVQDEAPKAATWWNEFHHLWTKAVGSADYVKSEWVKLEGLLLGASRPSPADSEDTGCR